MPGTTRYSATFDRTYEEEDNIGPAEAPVTRRSRSQSLQVGSSAENGRYRPLIDLQHSRSPSVDKSQIVPKGAEVIPTRTAGKATVKAHNNPFQFVKINTTPLQQKAEQLKILQQIKKPPVVKEDEEEWQMNLDSWKSRRRKMSETAIRRQEELKQLELEDNVQGAQQKKTKTFSEMLEERAHRGRAVSLCLFSSPLESSDWIFEASKSRSNRVRSQDPLSGESAESSTMNSEDDNDSYMKQEDDDENKNNFYNVNNNTKSHLTNGHTHNGIENSASNSSMSRASELSESEASQHCLSAKDRSGSAGGYIDSGLESLSSSHRTGDIPDSGSDFSHDSGSSLDCDSPRVSALITTGMELLEEFSSKDEEQLFMKNSSQKQDNILDTVTNNSSHPVSPPSLSSSTETSNSVPKSKVKKVYTQETKPPTIPNQKSSNVNVNSTKISSATSPTKKNVKSENEVFVNDVKELKQIKSQQKNKPVKDQLSSSLTNSLNVIYNSNEDEKSFKKPLEVSKSNDSTSSKSSSSNFSLIGEVPVEKITEEMERLILEQLEEEEKAKEMSAVGNAGDFVTPDDKKDLDAPSKRAEPPKEKPPPPPSASPNENSLNRVNSTKRIIKEINRRRSDFLGIDSTSEQNENSETSVPPPPVLEDLLRAEREQERLRRQMLMSKIPTQPFLDEDEISKKEQEIIENLETEERLRQAEEVKLSNNDVKNVEEERINKLKEERRLEEERLVAEEQKARLEEARLLQQREEYIRKQEVPSGTVTSTSKLSPPSSTDAPSTNAVLSSTDKLSSGGDGQSNKDNVSSSSVKEISDSKGAPPATPPKPLPKKKEAIRKERERLRQEQEALQREREEHRQKVQREQEQQKKNAQNSHVPDLPVPRVGPPIPAKPTQLTHSSITSQVQEDSYNNASIGSREAVGNQVSGIQGPPPPANRQPRNAVARTKARVQQKIPCVRKQPEPSSEMRYNQNHWLIQEAEMRRIAEQKERQRNNEATRFISANQVSYHQKPYPDDYRQNAMPRPSNLPLSPNQNSSNYAVPAQLHSPDQHWTYSNVPSRNGIPPALLNMDKMGFPRPVDSLPGLTKSSKGIPLERQEQMLSVSGRKRCSHCGEELGRGAAMIIESLQLYYHIQCFQCCVCHAQLGNGSCGTDVRVRNNKLHCHNCYSNDEAGLKFSQV